ncbi:MAG: DUF2007 domain-containing protein [Epsilonproteobacteria bacterium]|nr:DUF2007 domain-containing protein [Campylobacterota bacterium]
MVQLYLARNPADAYILKGILESAGIACEVQGDQLYHLLGELPLSQESVPSVWIYDNKHFKEAEKILEKYKKVESSKESEKTTWQCPTCDEALWDQFTTCWRCGTQREMK